MKIRTRKQEFKAADLIVARIGGCRHGITRGRKFLRDARDRGLTLLGALQEARKDHEEGRDSDYYYLLTRLFPQVSKVDASNVASALSGAGVTLTNAQDRMLRTRLVRVDTVVDEIRRRAMRIYVGRKAAKTRAARRKAR